jgi:hypothetical protein
LSPPCYSQPEPGHRDSAGGFRGLREPNAFWYDNTHALFRLLSRAKVIGKTLLTRPPRMGKTVFCKMLGTYADCKTPEAVFDQCFKDTYILRAEDDVGIPKNHKASLLALKRKCCWLPLVSRRLILVIGFVIVFLVLLLTLSPCPTDNYGHHRRYRPFYQARGRGLWREVQPAGPEGRRW